MPRLRAIEGQVAGCLNALLSAGLKTAQPYNTYYGGANWAPGPDAQLGSAGAGMLPCLALSGTGNSLKLTCLYTAVHGEECLSVSCAHRDKQDIFTVCADLQLGFFPEAVALWTQAMIDSLTLWQLTCSVCLHGLCKIFQAMRQLPTGACCRFMQVARYPQVGPAMAQALLQRRALSLHVRPTALLYIRPIIS